MSWQSASRTSKLEEFAPPTLLLRVEREKKMSDTWILWRNPISIHSQTSCWSRTWGHLKESTHSKQFPFLRVHLLHQANDFEDGPRIPPTASFVVSPVGHVFLFFPPYSSKKCIGNKCIATRSKKQIYLLDYSSFLFQWLQCRLDCSDQKRTPETEGQTLWIQIYGGRPEGYASRAFSMELLMRIPGVGHSQ